MKFLAKVKRACTGTLTVLLAAASVSALAAGGALLTITSPPADLHTGDNYTANLRAAPGTTLLPGHKILDCGFQWQLTSEKNSVMRSGAGTLIGSSPTGDQTSITFALPAAGTYQLKATGQAHSGSPACVGEQSLSVVVTDRPGQLSALPACPAPFNDVSTPAEAAAGGLTCQKEFPECPAGFDTRKNILDGSLRCSLKKQYAGWTDANGEMVIPTYPQPNLACPARTDKAIYGTTYFTTGWNRMGCRPIAKPVG